jgi:hypothetical protein
VGRVLSLPVLRFLQRRAIYPSSLSDISFQFTAIKSPPIMMVCRSLEDHALDYGAATIGTIDGLRPWDNSDDLDRVIRLGHALSSLARVSH